MLLSAIPTTCYIKRTVCSDLIAGSALSDELTIGLDIGGTKMAFVVADRRGKVLESRTLPTQTEAGVSDTLDRIGFALNMFVAKYERISGIGIGVPGPVDSERGVALLAANLGWRDLALRDAIHSRLSRRIPVYVENDVNAGAIGEGRFGAAKGVDSYVFLMVGTGFGGAVLRDKRLLRGASRSEMEIGHVSLDPVNGRQCACGQRGCLEMSIAGKGIIAHAQQHLAEYQNTGLSADALTTREIISAAQRNDPLARHVMAEAARTLGIACAWCANLFNPPLIILGGGLIHASYDLSKAQIVQSLRAHSLPLNFDAVSLKLSALVDGALGASALVWYYQEPGR